MRKEDPTGTLRLIGRIVDEQQRPMRDALVRLDPGERTLSTDADGMFEFDRLSSQRYRLTAKKGELYAGPLMARAAEPSEPVELQLHRGGTLVIHVTANGAPIAGARVSIDHVFTEVTNADGTATICGLSPEYHDGWVTAEGWAPAFLHSFSHQDPGGVTERSVSLQAGARIEGSVIGPGDAPVPDANIALWREGGGHYVGGAKSASDGTWCIEALQAGTFRVHVTSGDAPRE